VKPIYVGLLGLGTVGSGTIEVLRRNREEISRRAGRDIVIKVAGARDLKKERGVSLEGIELVARAGEIVARPDIDIVVELIGGETDARELVLKAIEAGKHVVTANKALLAKHGTEIFSAAHRKGVMVAFEASVAGGIPIIKAIREGLSANRIEWIAGIINGTCNYILTEMRDKGLPFDMVLAEAQRLGYAEAIPRSTSRASMRRTSSRSSPRSPSASRCSSTRSTPRASRSSRRSTSNTRRGWATVSSSWASRGERRKESSCACIRR
jgi:homoserine dehydrogenase